MIENLIKFTLASYLFVIFISILLFFINLIPLPLLATILSFVALIFPAIMLLILPHPKFVRKI